VPHLFEQHLLLAQQSILLAFRRASPRDVLIARSAELGLASSNT
jgi:hypothetical protein